MSSTSRLARVFAGSALAAVAAFTFAASASAQTELKWAHVYEASEPYHHWAQ